MHIELRKLKVVDALSEETTCYSAEIWIDGQRAFLASNRGHGAADDYHAVGSVTEQAVDAWLAANRPVSRLGDSVMPHCLEFEVAACRFPLRSDPVFPSRIDPGEGMSRRAGFGSSW